DFLRRQLAPSLPGSLCQSGCGRPATRSSGYVWAWHCDPAVSVEEKREALKLGGRRGAMSPSEVARLLEGADLDSREGRQELRDRFLRLRLAGRIGTGVYRDLLAAVDGAARDGKRTPTKPAARELVVEPWKFSNGEAS